jgi:hypothetical protein
MVNVASSVIQVSSHPDLLIIEGVDEDSPMMKSGKNSMSNIKVIKPKRAEVKSKYE